MPHINKWLKINNIPEYTELKNLERNVKSRTKPLQYNSSKNGFIIENSKLNSIKGTVIMDRLLISIEKGINPTIIERINQPTLPTGLENKLFT
jgi:hypothetical protein